MKKNNKKISSSDLKLWSQILDKVEPIKKSGSSKATNQKESVIEDNIIVSRDLSEHSAIKKSVKQKKIINEELPKIISNNNSEEKAEFLSLIHI